MESEYQASNKFEISLFSDITYSNAGLLEKVCGHREEKRLEMHSKML